MAPEQKALPSQLIFGESADNLLSELIKNKNCFYLFDQNVFELWKGKINTRDSKVFVVQPGDDSKSLQQSELIFDFLLENKADKNSLIINIGGGMICDLGGFCASIYKRGISFVNVPTSLLAMVDASIGGKTAVNFANRKNSLGTNAQPQHVIICSSFLESLPKNEMLCGYAEIIKHSIIAGGDLFAQLEHGFPRQSDLEKWNDLISTNVKIKIEITDKDPFDQHIRQVLNLGHTAAHAIESFGMKVGNGISHGNAVAAGLIIEADLSNKLGYLNEGDKNRIVALIERYFKRIQFKIEDIDSILGLAFDDKKNTDGKLTFSLPFAIGDVRYGNHCTPEIFKSSLIEYIK